MKIKRFMILIVAILLLAAAFKFQSIFIWASTSFDKTVPLGTTNIYNLDFDKLSLQIHKALQTDNQMIYIGNTMQIRFKPDGTLEDFLLSFYTSKTYFGKQTCLAYQSGFEKNKLVIYKACDVESGDYSRLINSTAIELNSFLKGLEIMNLQSILSEYSADSPPYYAIQEAQLNRNGRISKNEDIYLYISGSGCTELTENQKLDNNAIGYMIIPLSEQEEHRFIYVYVDLPYIKSMLNS